MAGLRRIAEDRPTWLPRTAAGHEIPASLDGTALALCHQDSRTRDAWGAGRNILAATAVSDTSEMVCSLPGPELGKLFSPMKSMDPLESKSCVQDMVFDEE
jgi:hypothetical protein